MFFYYGYTPLNRFGVAVEFILEYPKYGVMITVLWWFIVIGINRGK